VQFLFDVVKLTVHVRYLSPEPTAIIVLNATSELVVEVVSFGPKVLEFALNMSVGAVFAHLRSHMIHHPVEVIDVAVKPADGVLIFPMLEHSMLVTARPVLFVNRLLSALLLNVSRDILIWFMRGCREGQTAKADNRSRCDGNKLFHIVFRCGRFDVVECCRIHLQYGLGEYLGCP